MPRQAPNYSISSANRYESALRSHDASLPAVLKAKGFLDASKSGAPRVGYVLLPVTSFRTWERMRSELGLGELVFVRTKD